MTGKRYYVVDMRHDSTGEAEYKVCKTLDEAADRVEDFMKSYDFEIKNGKPFDPGNVVIGMDDRGYEVFDNVEYHNGRVIAFMHCGGDGPCVRTEQEEE